MTKKNTTINVENKEQYKKRSMWAEVWRNYKKNPSAMIGLVIVVALVLLAVFARIYFDFDTDIVQQDVQNKFQHPNGEHWFG
ncbi:MAG: ABC transporter permease, partial [Firmicutes bacterium]|nr:ABC transporter permease [Bacillota bacterium]